MKSSEIRWGNSISHFHNLIKQNEYALAHLSNIRLKLIAYGVEPWKAKVGQITKEYDSCVRAIMLMKDACDNIDDPAGNPNMAIKPNCKCECCESLSKYGIDGRIKEAEEKGVLSVLKLEGIIDGIVPKTEEIKTMEELYETVEKLNITESVDVEVKNISTLHDCIRYLHQKGLDLMFNSEIPSKIPFYKKHIVAKNDEGDTKDICYLDVIDIAPKKQACLERLFAKEPENSDKDPDILEKVMSKVFSRKKEEEREHLPVRAIIEGYQEINQKRIYSQSVKVLASEDTALCQIKLGQHLAKLESKINDEDSFISINYMDSGYSHSSNRLAYMKLVLDKLGYTVEINGQNIKANLCNKSKEQTYGTLKETIRLLTSSKDLDVCEDIEKRVYEAAYRFLKGEIEIRYKLDASDKMDQEECKEFVSNYNYDWGNVEI